MRTAAWEIAPQIVLKNCSKEVAGKESVHVILVKGECMQSSTYIFLVFVESFRWPCEAIASHKKQSSP